MRAAVTIGVLVIGLCLARPAHARGMAVIVSGDDISYMRDLAPREVTLLGFARTDLGYDPMDIGPGPVALGYHYQRFGVFWLDLWRWSGEPVAYRGKQFWVLTDDQLETLHARVPLAYHLPPGLMIVLGLLELAVVTSVRLKLWLTVAIGQILIVTSLAFYVAGLELSFLVPLALGLFHLYGAWMTRRALVGRAPVVVADPPRPKHAVELPVPPPNVETDPFRAPPQVHIVPVQHAVVAPTPIALDATADKPKLLG